jgi:TonB family protein
MLAFRNRYRVLVPLAMGVAMSCASSNPAQPATDGLQRGSTGVQVPTISHRVEPAYPLELRQQGVTGVVVVAGTVPKEGGVLRNPRVEKSDDPRLNQLALAAVSRWIWRPGFQDGKAVDVEFRTEVRFSLNR